jgi:Cu+-exporting ATPase
MFRDPVSGVRVSPEAAVASREHGGEVFYFASQETVDEYDTDPHYYGHQNPLYDDSEDLSVHHHHHH